MPMRGIRGATTVDTNTRDAILTATRELLVSISEANRLHPDDVASVIFTTSRDLNAAYPAAAAREMDWNHVALLCTHEMDVAHGLKRCIRILIHWNTSVSQDDVKHVYIKGAAVLRPDLISL